MMATLLKSSAVVACVLSLVVSCGGHSGHATATLTGVVRGYGGPATVVNGSTHQVLNGDPMADQEVTASSSGKVAASTVTDSGGRYVLRLPPGTYTVIACITQVQITLRAGQSKTADLSCSVP